MKKVFETGGPNSFTKGTQAITVYQRESKTALFTIIYGLQVQDSLTYDKCCLELGAAILHMQCCEGIASNEGL